MAMAWWKAWFASDGLVILVAARRTNDDNKEQEVAMVLSKSDMEVERRLDHDVSWFEMVCPSKDQYHGIRSPLASKILDSRLNIQDSHIV